MRIRLAKIRVSRFAALVLVLSGAGPARADYNDLVTAFTAIRATTVFPVPTRSLDDVESAFGPRKQSSTGLQDFHRGIDIDGGSEGDPVGVESVVAVLNGKFYDYRTSVSGGNTVILEHEFVSPISYQGKTLTKYFTWYLHLYDDGIEGNGIGTSDLVAGLTKGDAVNQGTVIGKMGATGAPSSGEYAPHLHFELRVGSVSSLEFQLANPGTTQWGFDPHLNPLWLFTPYTHGAGGASGYQQAFSRMSGGAPGSEIRLKYEISNDDMPLANRFEFEIVDRPSGTTVASHVLDWNQRTGYDATSTANLDARDTTKPFFDPSGPSLAGATYSTELVLPDAWTHAYQTADHDLRITSTDIWGNSVQYTAAVVPEPAEWAVVVAVGLGTLAAARRWRVGRGGLGGVGRGRN